MNSASQNRQAGTSPMSTSPNQQSLSSNQTTPLPASEIESLLRSARRNLDQQTSLEPDEELGPGDVQHLRGASKNESADLEAIVNAGLQLETQPKVVAPIQQSEQRIPQAIVDSKQVRRGGLTLEDLADVDLDISIELGRTEILIEEVLKLREGSVVALDRLAGDPVDIIANGRLIARGELLVVEGKFAVRLSEVL